MPSCFQSAVFGSSLVYPNAVVWSEENLVAVASGNTVSILNPSNPGVRGVITIPSSKPFPLGVIDGEGADLVNGCMLPCILSKDSRPCVRSISWSPMGLTNNAGCLLAVCTTAGRVKLYRFPFCEFSVEWIEVLDVSELLYNYFKSTDFGDSQIVSSEILEVISRKDNADRECTDDTRVSSLRKNPKRKRQDEAMVVANDSDCWAEKNTLRLVSTSITKGKPRKKEANDLNLPPITTNQYASRDEMLMSLVVAWSPVLETFGNCSILAVGGKCGRISLWRVHAPECYSIDNPKHTSKVKLLGLLKAHDTWITAIAWTLYDSKVSPACLLLATGSSNGRVKIWHANIENLANASEIINDSFSLLTEVTPVNYATISVLSLTVPLESPCKLFLAIGKGSGSLEVWVIDMLTRKIEKIGCYYAHDHIVTGLAWAFDGRCLYSCSQDNSMKSWVLVKTSLCEVPIPTNAPGLKSSSEVSYVYGSSFGLAISPGNLAIAVARGFKAGILNPMYQGRSHKAAVEFLWIGGQQLDLSASPSPANCPDSDKEYFPEGFPEKELFWWESNITWSLNRYSNLNRLLNIWDVLTSLLAFKNSSPTYAENILRKWLNSFSRSKFDFPESIKSLCKLSSRLLHLINIITRRVVLKEYKGEIGSEKLEGLDVTRDDNGVNEWILLLLSSEREILERLVGLYFSAVLMGFCKNVYPQMEQWVSQNGQNVKDLTKSLASQVRKFEKRDIEGPIGDGSVERCSFCSCVVPFESTENAMCVGVNCDDGVSTQRHKLKRCGVTMRILPTKPSWYCACCQRQSVETAPNSLFRMLEYPSDFKPLLEPKNSSIPRCPFCGILLRRVLPAYSLSPSPVITQNTPSYRAAGKMLEERRRNLFWTPCAAYCIDKILEEIMKHNSVRDCVEKGQKITKFIYNRIWLLNLMKKEFTEGAELLKPFVTRSASSFTTLQTLLDHRVGLRRMVQSNKWISSRFSKLDAGKEVKNIVLDNSFWRKVQFVRRSIDPIVEVLEKINSDESLSMPFIYNDMDRAKLAIKTNHNDGARKYEPFWSVIDNHWSSLFHHPLYLAAYFLNPSYRYRSDFILHPDVVRGLNACIMRLESDNARRISASMQISGFGSAKADFGTDLAISTRSELDPAAWWQQHGINCLELQRIAVRILSQSCSSFGCEHNWSIHDQLYEQRHNRLARKRSSSNSIPSFDSVLQEDLLYGWIVEIEKQTLQEDEVPLELSCSLS